MDLTDYGSSSEEEQSPKQLDDSEPSSAHSSEDEESLKEYQEPTPSPKKEPASPPEIEPVEPKILPVHFDGLPPSPPGQCSENVADRFIELFKYKKDGLNMTTHITSRKEFKNPAIYDKLIEDFGVNEYGTNYPCTGGDTIPLDPSDYYDKLSEEQINQAPDGKQA